MGARQQSLSWLELPYIFTQECTHHPRPGSAAAPRQWLAAPTHAPSPHFMPAHGDSRCLQTPQWHQKYPPDLHLLQDWHAHCVILRQGSLRAAHRDLCDGGLASARWLGTRPALDRAPQGSFAQPCSFCPAPASCTPGQSGSLSGRTCLAPGGSALTHCWSRGW